MTARKDHREKQTAKLEAPRFKADEIVRTIEAVQQAGLTVYGVEITLSGSISINTTPQFRNRTATSKPAPSAESADEVQLKKK